MSRSRTSRSRTSRRLALAVPAALGGLALTALPAFAASSPAQIATSKTKGVACLKSLQAADGSYAGSGLSNEWAFSAFAAAGTAVVDVAPAGTPRRTPGPSTATCCPPRAGPPAHRWSPTTSAAP